MKVFLSPCLHLKKSTKKKKTEKNYSLELIRGEIKVSNVLVRLESWLDLFGSMVIGCISEQLAPRAFPGSSLMGVMHRAQKSSMLYEYRLSV